VSLIVGEKSKQLLKPGSKLRMLLEQHLAPLLLSDPEFILKVVQGGPINMGIGRRLEYRL